VDDYLGIVVEQSFADRACLDRATIVAERAAGWWRLLLVRVPAAEFEVASRSPAGGSRPG
jgi:hypothetical protein